jgi:hypothetical protein
MRMPKIDARIKKAKSIMGFSKYFTKKNLSSLKRFHHGAIRHILHTRWHLVREKHIKKR